MTIANKYEKGILLQKEAKQDLFDMLSDYINCESCSIDPWFDGTDVVIEFRGWICNKEQLLTVLNVLANKGGFDGITLKSGQYSEHFFTSFGRNTAEHPDGWYKHGGYIELRPGVTTGNPIWIGKFEKIK